MEVSSLENQKNWASFTEIGKAGVGYGDTELGFLCVTGIT